MTHYPNEGQRCWTLRPPHLQQNPGPRSAAQHGSRVHLLLVQGSRPALTVRSWNRQPGCEPPGDAGEGAEPPVLLMPGSDPSFGLSQETPERVHEGVKSYNKETQLGRGKPTLTKPEDLSPPDPPPGAGGGAHPALETKPGPSAVGGQPALRGSRLSLPPVLNNQWCLQSPAKGYRWFFLFCSRFLQQTKAINKSTTVTAGGRTTVIRD